MMESQYTKETFLSHESVGQADEAVSEIFETVLGVEVASAASGAEGEGEDRSGVVSFFGAMSGSLEVRMDTPAARFVTSAFLGGSPVEDGEDSTINDAVGELCNLIAGGWKNRNESLSWGCYLTPPNVALTGAPRLDVGAQVRRKYRFGDHSLRITLQCDGLAA